MYGRACGRQYLRRCESSGEQTIAVRGRVTGVRLEAGTQR